MRLLLLSESIDYRERFEEPHFTPPYDVQLEVGNLNDADIFFYSVFDYDVAILHIHNPRYSSFGYLRNIPRVAKDTSIALEQGRSIICLPGSPNFRPERHDEIGDPVYNWLRDFGIVLKSNIGADIKPSGAGRAHAIQEYLKYVHLYHQIVIEPKTPPERRLAVVDDTEIVVGLEHPCGQGTLVILPPPDITAEVYILAMSRLVDVAKRYYERAQRRIPIGDAPDWVRGHLVPIAIKLNGQIEELSEQKSRYDRIAYVLYGTGDELEESVALLLSELGLEVKRQPRGANIDFRASHSGLNIGFALEVTGTKGAINKDSSKVAQAWQYLNNRVGTSEENDRLIIIANTQYHLNPKDRTKESFTPEAVKLLSSNGVLLVTTLQLYERWKAVHEGQKAKEDIIKEFHSQFGLYTPR